MPFRPSKSRKIRPSRPLALEPLEPRALCALSPIHAVIPASAVVGSTLQPDGSVEIYGNNPPAFPSEVIFVDTSGTTHPSIATDHDNADLQRQWSVASDGRLLDSGILDEPAQENSRTVYAVSPDGSWFIGLKRATSASEQGSIAVWRRGTNDLVPVGLTAEQTGGPMDLGISDSGDVIYKAYVGEDVRSYVWDRTDGLQTLQSLYATEGNTSPDAAQFALRAISADGQTIIGTSGGGSLPTRATKWVNGVAQELPSGAHTKSYAYSSSNDGRVIGGSVGEDTAAGAAVWVDGVLHELTSASGTSGFGPPIHVVNGIGGDPNSWAAMGLNWIARSDGVMTNISNYFPDEFGLSLTGNIRPLRLLANTDALYVLAAETISSISFGLNNETKGKIATHLLVLPLDYSHSPIAALDLSGDMKVSPADALLIINAINENPGATLFNCPELRLATPKIDVNGDGDLTPADALQIINFLNNPASTDSTSAGEGEAPPSADALESTLATDALFSYLATPRKSKQN